MLVVVYVVYRIWPDIFLPYAMLHIVVFMLFVVLYVAYRMRNVHDGFSIKTEMKVGAALGFFMVLLLAGRERVLSPTVSCCCCLALASLCALYVFPKVCCVPKLLYRYGMCVGALVCAAPYLQTMLLLAGRERILSPTVSYCLALASL